MLPRMRTIEQCEKLIKQIDEGSAITEWFIRCLVRDNKVLHFNTGKKVLVNFDNLLEYLNTIFGVKTCKNFSPEVYECNATV